MYTYTALLAKQTSVFFVKMHSAEKVSKLLLYGKKKYILKLHSADLTVTGLSSSTLLIDQHTTTLGKMPVTSTVSLGGG